MGQPTPERQSQEQDNLIKNTNVGGALTFAPVQIGTKIETFIVESSLEKVTRRKLNKNSPYQGLKKFNFKDRDRFFGRDKLIARLFEAVNRSSLSLVLGASGSGKSSVVRAGLIPELKKSLESQMFYDFIFTPNQDPFDSLYRCLLSEEKDYSFKKVEAEMALEAKADTLTKVINTLKKDEERWLIFVDQFEQLFTIRSDLDKRKNFIASLIQVAKSENSFVKIVLAMRSDFLEQLSFYPDLGRLANQNNIHLVTEMYPDELRQAIEQPAARHGVVFEEGLVEQIIEEVEGQKGYLPLLEYTLDLLWESECQTLNANGCPNIEDRILNKKSYVALEGVRGALQKRVNEIYSNLNQDEQTATKQIFLKLVNIVDTDSSSRTVSRRAYRDEFVGESVEKTLNRFIEENLLVSGSEYSSPEELQVSASKHLNQSATVEIAHEILLSSWDVLKRWLEQEKEAIILKNWLASEARRWQKLRLEDKSKAQDELLKGSRLAQIIEFRKKNAFQNVGGLSKQEEEFINVSVEQRDRLQKAEADRHRREIRTARGIAIGSTVAAIALTGLTILSGVTIRKSEIEQLRALRITSEQLLLSNQDLEALTEILKVGKKLDSSIWQAVWPEPNLRSQVTETLHRVVYAVKERNRLSGNQDRVIGVSFSPNGQLVATTELGSGTVRLWDLEGKQVKTFQEHQSLISVSFSPNSKLMVTADENGIARLWDMEGKRIAKLGDSVRQAIFSLDSKLLATIERDDSVRLWDITGKQIAVLRLPRHYNDYVSSIIFSPNGKSLATTEARGTIRLWNSDGRPITEFKVDELELGNSQVAFSSDGQFLAVAENYVDGRNSRVTLRDLKGNQIAEFKGHTSSVYNLTFSPDGELLATASHDGTARLWDLQGKQVAELRGHEGSVRRIVFSPNGQQIATASWDGTARLWDLQGKQVDVLRGHQGIVDDVSFSPDGKLLATSGNDRTARLWDLEGKQVARFHQHPSGVDVDSSPNDKLLAIAGIEKNTGNQTISLWNWFGEKLKQLINHGSSGVSSLHDVAFSPDGQLLATAEEGGIARIWNLEGKQLLHFQADRSRLLHVHFSANSQLLATAGVEGIPRLWDLEGNRLAEFKVGIRLMRFSFSPDGQQLATAGDDGSVYLWDLKGNQKTNFKAHQGNIWDISFSPDGQQLATAGDDRIAHLWDLKGKPLTEFRGHQESIYDLAFSPNGQYLATAGDRTARLWDLKGNQLAEFSKERVEIQGVSFGSDGQQLITVSDDGTIDRYRIEGFDELMVRGCDWVRDYLKNNPDVKEIDKHLCNR